MAVCCARSLAIDTPCAIGNPYEWSVTARVLIAQREARLDDRLQRLLAVAVHRMHLQVAAVVCP